MSLIALFNLGMMREYEDAVMVGSSLALNLGPGEKHIPGAEELEWPEWDAEKDSIPFPDNHFERIHCYHFLEHIANVPFVMREIRRVLQPGGVVNIVVPYYSSSMQAQDLDHKSQFTENTWKISFDTSFYSKGKIEPMDIITNFIMGDEEKNLALVTQLQKPWSKNVY